MFHKHGGDIYSYNHIQDFSANINARGMPEAVRRAAEQGVAGSIHYPDPGYRSLRSALAERENQSEEKVRPEQIICGNGAAELMFALAAALRPGHAFLAVPSFFEYEQALASFGCEIKHFFLGEEQKFQLGEAFLDAIPHETDIIVLGNPNNPTGRLIEGGVLEKLIRKCREENIFLVLDESFFDFLTEEDRSRTFSGVEYIAENPGLFVLKSFTKMYGMPGLRFGYGICSDTMLLEDMRQVMQPWNVSVPAERAALAAAGDLEFARNTAVETAINRTQMMRWMQEAGYLVFPSQTNFLLFEGPPDLQEYCLKRGYLIRACSNFPGLERSGKTQFFRICVRTREENEALMQVLREAGGDLKG